MNPMIASMMNQSVQHFQGGNLERAEAVLKQVLQIHSREFDALHLLGIIAGMKGEHAEAGRLFKKAAAINPNHVLLQFNMAKALSEAGDDAGSLQHHLKAAKLAPNEPDIWVNYGRSLANLRRHDEALAAYRKALGINPGHVEALTNMGESLMRLARLEESLECFNGAVKLNPNLAEVWSNLGVALKEAKRDVEALAAFDRSLALVPGLAGSWVHKGAIFSRMKHHQEALASYARALALNPNLANAWLDQGRVFNELERFDEAEFSLDQAVSLAPGDATNWFNRAYARTGRGRHQAALLDLDHGLAMAPDTARAHNHRGNTLRSLQRLGEAEASYRRAIALVPGYVEAHANLGVVLVEQGHLEQGVASYREALSWDPAFAEAYCCLGDVARHLGDPEDAAMHYRQALRLKPDFALAYSNLLYAHAYHGLGSNTEYLELARGWERACIAETARADGRKRVFRNPPRAGRRLKVGYVSGDFRQHSVSYFLEQLLKHHRRDQVELYAYSTHDQEDAVTARLRALVDHWVPAAAAADAALRDRIESDGVDVLIDLSGHTAHARLGVFARRAAPVQAHYLGYFASTGLTEMDYWIGDGIITPAPADADFSEKIWRLPRMWVSYEGKHEAPVPERQPREDGGVWLGSFNSLGKVTQATLDTWAGILRALPEGRLLLKARELADAENRMRILQTMESAGVARERVELLDWNSTPDWQSHMACYNRLDIALDPIGAVGGGTTTCDALWMAVPVVALKGDRMAARMTESMLDAVGHPEWLASSREDYISKAVDLARSPDQRNVLRAGLRAQMAASPLCDARDLALRLEAAYAEMYDRWWMNKNETR